MRVLARISISLSAPLSLLALSLTIYAQGDPGSKPPPPTNPGRTPPPKVIYVDRPREKIVRVLPQTGELLVVAESGASLKLQLLRNGTVIKEYQGEGYTIGSDERSIKFKNLPPGQYRVMADLDGYRPGTSPPVTVKAGAAEKVELNLEMITYAVTVKLNAPSGTLKYAKGSEVPRSVNFQNNQAVLSGLTGGDYSIEIIADDAAYKPKNTTLSVSSDRQIGFELERLESRPFGGATASDWALPNGWSFSGGKMIVRGSGMALPSDVGYRQYQDFQLSTDVRMVNGIAASFAVRVVDPQNYYLVQITGPNADEPYVLRGFIVKNGVAQRFGRTTPTSQFSGTLKPGKFFNVVLTMKDADITVRVNDSETGELLKLGILPDPSRTFRIGAVGIAAREGEQNEFSAFSICVKGCQNP